MIKSLSLFSLLVLATACGQESATALTVAASSTQVPYNTAVNVAATGGTTPYTYSVVAGTGSVVASSGAFTSPAVSGTCTVRVTDASGATADVAIAVDPSYTSTTTATAATALSNSISISVTDSTLALQGTTTVNVSGGTAPYQFFVRQGGGFVASSTGTSTTYTAPNGNTTALVGVQDSWGQIAFIQINVATGN